MSIRISCIGMQQRRAGRTAPVAFAAMSKVLVSLPAGERVGIAFSGGLDTSVAVAWMREHGAVPYAYTADLGQYDEDDIGAIPGRAREYGAEQAPARRLQAGAGARGPRRAASAARSTSAPPAARTSTRRRSAARSPARCWCRRCARTASTIWGDGSTYKGNDIERFYRYGLLANPMLRIYKPWLDADFVEELGGRHEMSEWLRARDLPYRASTREGVLDGREHLGRDARGEAARAPRRVDGPRAADHGRAVLGRRPSRSPTEEVTLGFDGGLAGRDRRPPRSPTWWSWCARRTRSAAGTASACPTRSRTGSSRRRAAASTRRRAWRCCAIAYERLVERDPQRGHAGDRTARRGAGSAGCCTRAAGSTRRR